MMKKIYSVAIILSFATPVLVSASDTTEILGFIDFGIQSVNINDDSDNTAKFEEFQDRDNNVFGQAELKTYKGAYHFSLKAENPGADDQSFEFQGGKYGIFKYNFKYDEMPHNYSYDAKTFYYGIGHNNLFVGADPADVSTWSKFDYKTKHKNYGGTLDVSLGSPFYVSIGAERREVDGTRPYSVRLNAEVPEPIYFTTDVLNLKVGYAGETFSASITGYMSSFDNRNTYLNWEDPGSGSTQVDALAPENDYNKVAGDFSWRGLPLRSVVAVGASYAHLDNDFSATDINIDTTIAPLDTLNRTTFDGDIDYTALSFALSSRPLAKMNTKIYYRYLDKDNDSTYINYDFFGTPVDNAAELLSYEKDTAGIDIGYRLPQKTKLRVGYEYMNIDRSTDLPNQTAKYRYDDPDDVTDDTVYVQLKNSALDWLTAKVRYKRLDRDSDHTDTYDPTLNASRFDVTDKTMDEWKLSLEFYPLDRLDLGLDYTYKDNDYDDIVSGRTDDKRQQIYADFLWRAFKELSFSGFVGFENTKADSRHLGDLFSDPYISKIDDDFWTYGLVANMPVKDKLTFNVSWQYQKSDGALDFDSLDPLITYVDISDSDDYTKQVLEAKATYTIDLNWKLTVAYVYEKLEYDDINFANYQYEDTNGGDYYSGIYADQGYEANIASLKVTYEF